MIRFFAVAALCVFGAAAQFPGGPDQTILRGQVLSDQLMAESYIVELQPLSGSMNRQQTLASNNGEFQMNGVELGDYRLTITDHGGRLLYQQFLHVDKSGAPIEVRLPSNGDAKPPAGAVSYASLQHKVPRLALHEYKAAVAARQHADREAALAHLRKAVAIDPQFAAGHNDLAALYLDGKLYDSALDELDKAAALDPASIPVKLNRAICLSKLGRYAEAETPARQAVQLDGGSQRSRYLLGLILANQKKFGEAIDDLEQSSDQFPEARVAAAQILVRSGRNAEARQQLQLYLNGCKAENCKSVRSWLERLVE